MQDNTFYTIEVSLEEMVDRYDDFKWFSNHTHSVAVLTHPTNKKVRLCYLDKESAIEALNIAKIRYKSIGEVVIVVEDVPNHFYNMAKEKKDKAYLL